MKKSHWLSLIGILLAAVLVIPASAESVYTRFENGSTLITNGSYWMLWEPVGNHAVGDRFFVNGTTNLPAGTVILYQFFEVSYHCHTKVCSRSPSATSDRVTVEKSPFLDVNMVSVPINTTGYYSGEYLFGFETYSPSALGISKTNVTQPLLGSHYLNTIIILSAESPRYPVNPTPFSLDFVPVYAALFLALGIGYIINKRANNGKEGGKP